MKTFKNTQKYLVNPFTTAVVLLLLLLPGLLLSIRPSKNPLVGLKQAIIQKVSAEDDEEEDDSEDESDSYEEDYTAATGDAVTTTDTPADTQVSPAPQVQYTWVPIGAYGIDTDKDGLVDAIDPDPKVPQQMYFTDSDGDGVPDALDQYPGENDFLYVDDTDLNNNGIWDSLEN